MRDGGSGSGGLRSAVSAAALRRHRWFLGVLALGALLRALAMLGYRPALWFPDSYTYVVTALRPSPDLVRPAGYPLLLLRPLAPLHSFGAVVAVQHLLGLALGVLIYVTARRLRAPRWAATLAAAPVLLDAYQIQLEHLLVSDLLFAFLVAAAACLALRAGAATRRRTALAAGLLLAAAALTRTVGLPLLALFAAWFLIRSGWRTAVTLLVAAVVPLAGYAAWFTAEHGRFGLVGANGVFLYARTMAFADCAVMRPRPELAVLCDPRPAQRRPPIQEYIWDEDSPLVKLPGITFRAATDRLAGEFAWLAIRSQPLDYLRTTVSELGRSFTWGRPVYPDQEIYDYYEFPEKTPGPPGRYPATVGARLAVQYEQGPIATEVVEPFAGVLRVYQAVVRLPGAVLLIVLLAAPALAALQLVRFGLRGLDSSAAAWLLPWLAAVVLLVMPAAVAEFDYRYVLPAVPLACLAAALAGAGGGPKSRKPNVSSRRPGKLVKERQL